MHPVVEKLYQEIEHGDDKHRAWLREKLESWSRRTFGDDATHAPKYGGPVAVARRERILPRDRWGGVREHPRVKVIGHDAQGFTIVEAQLFLDEEVCWRCETPALDLDSKLKVCPTCGGDFND